MKHKLGEHDWDIRFPVRVNRKGDDGECDADNRVIRVRRSLRGQERLRVVLHEALHALLWHGDEEWIDDVSTDLAAMITDLGYTESD